jgi:hypothetical protein
MYRVFSCVALAVAITAATASSSSAAILMYAGTFSGLNENPVNNSAGTGVAFVRIDTNADTITLHATFSGLTGNVSAAHIHAPAAPGSNASVLIPEANIFAGFPSGGTSGVYNHVYSLNDELLYRDAADANGANIAGAKKQLLDALANSMAYFNIHTNFRPGGEIRANLAPVPEPASLVVWGLASPAVGNGKLAKLPRQL